MNHTTYIISKNHKYESSHIYVSRILLSLPGFNEICLVSIGESRRTRIGQTPRYQSLAILRLRKLNTGSCFPHFLTQHIGFWRWVSIGFLFPFQILLIFQGFHLRFPTASWGVFLPKALSWPSKGLDLAGFFNDKAWIGWFFKGDFLAH